MKEKKTGNFSKTDFDVFSMMDSLNVKSAVSIQLCCNFDVFLKKTQLSWE